MSDPACRYGGGTGGKENRYHFPAADDARFSEARPGADDGADGRWSAGQSERVPESNISTADGPPRGTLGGAVLPKDRGGFC